MTCSNSRHGGSKKERKGGAISLLPPCLLYYVGSCDYTLVSRKESGQQGLQVYAFSHTNMIKLTPICEDCEKYA